MFTQHIYIYEDEDINTKKTTDLLKFKTNFFNIFQSTSTPNRKKENCFFEKNTSKISLTTPLMSFKCPLRTGVPDNLALAVVRSNRTREVCFSLIVNKQKYAINPW